MLDFLDRAERVERTRHDLSAEDGEAFRLVFEAAARLQMAQAKASIDLTNIEHLFSAFEMADMLQLDLGLERAGKLSDAMRRLICRTLQYEMPIQRVKEQGGVFLKAADSYDQLAMTLCEQSTKRVDSSYPTVITFNYDIALDFALQANAIEIDYGMGTKSPLDRLKLLKLHGSLNWARLESGDVTTLDLATVLRNAQLPRGMRPVVVDLSPYLKHAGAEDGLPFIVPPTWNKWGEQNRIRRVWAEAAEALKTAEYIAVVGYSLPRTDQFFRYLFALGVMGETRIKDVLVVDPNRKVQARFKGLLAQSTVNRFRFDDQPWERSTDFDTFLRLQV